MDEIGPSVPSDWKSGRNNDRVERDSDSSTPTETTIGPVLPHTAQNIGPYMPAELNLHASDSELDEGEDESVSIGPVLPLNRSRRQQKDSSSDDDGASYGPQLPSSIRSRSSKVDDDDSYGPRLPQSVSSKQNTDSYGPRLSHSLSKDSEDDNYGPRLPPTSSATKQESSSDDDCYGPSLPPSVKDKDNDNYGPRLPPTSSASKQDSSSDDDCYGPSLPPSSSTHSTKPGGQRSQVKGPSLPPSGQYHNEDEEEEEEDVIGPMPCRSSDFTGPSAAEEFEKRAMAMKDKLTGKDKTLEPKREEWMMELPGYGKNFGLGPRSFRKNNMPDMSDRSQWTDTPADKERKAKVGGAYSGSRVKFVNSLLVPLK